MRQMPMRLGPRPHELIDRDSRFTFTWNGASYPAYRGDTITSALAAAGVRVFSRSLKYHRRRGLLTADFNDPGCLVEVDGEPNVRGSHRLVEPGMAVRAQNAWPSLRHDVKAVNQLVGRFLPVGFYYKTFIAPRRLWPLYERVLRRFSPGGPVPSPDARGRYDQRYAHPDVVVAGGGPAGLAAAVAAAAAGAAVLLVEENHRLGGHLRWSDPLALGPLLDAVVARPNIEVLTDAVVTGRYDGNWLAILHRGAPGVVERLVKVRAAQLVVAPGLIERPYVFAGNDLPGVMLSTAARRLLNLYAVRPGRRAVVFTANADGDAAAAELVAAGVDVAKVVDARAGGDIVRAHGRGRVRAVECADGSTVDCDLLVTAAGWTAPTALLSQAGDRPTFHEGAARFVPSAQLPDGVLATGGIAGDGSLAELLAHAEAVGMVAARRAGFGTTAVPIPELPIEPHPALFRSSTHGIVDFSEDVSSKDLAAAVDEGYDSIELAKRYTTATMGPAQGRLEAVNAIAVVAAATGRGIAATGTTTARPPYVPVSLGALAGRRYQRVRHTPMHSWHERHGATPLVAGTWIRPDHYGDPAAEVLAVRNGVGIIDVTPLGKFELRGPDVVRLLEQVYVNRWAKLAVGSVRYGVMCAEDGVVLDDGVTGRLGEDRYLMTTTSTGAAAVERWLQWWLQVQRPDWQVRVTPMTDAYASINVAGPHSRALVARLTDVDLDRQSFRYLQVRTGPVAGVAGCVLWRIGFTGELSYELHVPAGYGLAVWERLLERGADLGVRPFGVEAQRILRLEKGHLIVGQDTDGLTQAHGAGLSWAVKADKDDFAGKPELGWQRDRGGYPRLVGLQPVDGTVVPTESSQIVEASPQGRRIVGRVTSSRMSPTLGRSICLGYVAPHLAAAGTRVTVRLPDGREIPATVTPQSAHVDPDGTRLHA